LSTLSPFLCTSTIVFVRTHSPALPPYYGSPFYHEVPRLLLNPSRPGYAMG
jgi:hypothetical protein